MGTSCAIGLKDPDGKVRAIRCNYDGYVAGAGVILAGWYVERTKIEALLALGELSQLAAELADCVAYHRDRGEQLRPARTFASVEEYRETGECKLNAEYLYLYDDGNWLVFGLRNAVDWVRIEVKK